MPKSLAKGSALEILLYDDGHHILFEVLALLVARVEFDSDDSTLAISFHPSAIKTLAEGDIEDAA